MEKSAARLKITFLRFLQKPPPPNNIGKGYSGAIISIIPAQAHEPTSPKVSCMGQIKSRHKNQRKEKKNIVKRDDRDHFSLPFDFKPNDHEGKKEKAPSKVPNLFVGAKKKPSSTGRKSDPSVPSLGKLRQFSSDSLGSFDWKAHVAPVDGEYCSSDEETEGGEREVIVPFSAPLTLLGPGGGGGAVALEPRKEINLWKRRTTCQPSTLQVNLSPALLRSC